MRPSPMRPMQQTSTCLARLIVPLRIVTCHALHAAHPTLLHAVLSVASGVLQHALSDALPLAPCASAAIVPLPQQILRSVCSGAEAATHISLGMLWACVLMSPTLEALCVAVGEGGGAPCASAMAGTEASIGTLWACIGLFLMYPTLDAPCVEGEVGGDAPGASTMDGTEVSVGTLRASRV